MKILMKLGEIFLKQIFNIIKITFNLSLVSRINKIIILKKNHLMKS